MELKSRSRRRDATRANVGLGLAATARTNVSVHVNANSGANVTGGFEFDGLALSPSVAALKPVVVVTASPTQTLSRNLDLDFDAAPVPKKKKQQMPPTTARSVLASAPQVATAASTTATTTATAFPLKPTTVHSNASSVFATLEGDAMAVDLEGDFVQAKTKYSSLLNLVKNSKNNMELDEYLDLDLDVDNSPRAENELPCTHISKDEHDACPSKRCVWNPNRKNWRIPTSFDPARMKPFSRTAARLMRKYLADLSHQEPDCSAFRKYLTEFCNAHEHEEDSHFSEHVSCGCGNPDKHFAVDGAMGDFKRAWIDDYVTHYAKVWAEYEDSLASDGHRSTRDVEVREEVFELYEGFHGLKEKYRILDKIGEGELMQLSVYKAVDTMHKEFDSSWCCCSIDTLNPSPAVLGNRWAVCGVVALKRIYVTSSTDRILNELAMLKKLSAKPNVAGLISALRAKDQIIAVLPFYEFHDFRDFINENPTLEDVAYYMRALMIGLSGIHEENILHRDVKPTNFLYNKKLRTGVIVDFGLAQVVQTNPVREEVHQSMSSSLRIGYYENDKRPSIRGASRAGTRGFRAPEVLLRIVHQTTAIDIWAAGVILLCTLTKTYPFFNSPDDLDALLEITAIFGVNSMKKIATAQGRRILMTIPDYPKDPIPFEKIVERLNGRLLKENRHNTPEVIEKAFSFLRGCMCLAVKDRISAVTALQHPFLAELPR
ncbi:UNVERIFIED_CONTAM: hypothetical protein HDU68_004259 [Siphonaria sp. JEL0065]|nr:hypothetical protein HDU68_004259 [Siphonaria sp. JEL0065]